MTHSSGVNPGPAPPLSPQLYYKYYATHICLPQGLACQLNTC